jgi:HlyD family secretion protein
MRVLSLLFFLGLVSSCSPKKNLSWSGYVEGEFRLLSTLESGVVTRVHVEKGSYVEKDTVLASIAKTEILLSLEEAQSKFDFAQAEYQRAKILKKKQVISKSEFEKIETEFENYQSKLEEIKWHLSQFVIKAPTDGYVQNILKNVGEVASSLNPVIYFLPKEGIKIRFFVPEDSISRLKLGQSVIVYADGLEYSVPAKINFISNKPEFTPPVIYSNQLRQKLVFLVEGSVLSDGGTDLRLKPGQPIEVRPSLANAQ